MAIFPLRKHSPELKIWDPLEEISRLNEKVNHILDRFMNGDTAQKGITWLPALDVMEHEKEFIIKIDVPGMDIRNLSVQIEDDVLVIKGERESEKVEKKENFLHLERGYGAFVRSYALPEYVYRDKIKATCKEGVLTVVLSKMPGKQKEVKSVPITG